MSTGPAPGGCSTEFKTNQSLSVLAITLLLLLQLADHDDDQSNTMHMFGRKKERRPDETEDSIVLMSQGEWAIRGSTYLTRGEKTRKPGFLTQVSLDFACIDCGECIWESLSDHGQGFNLTPTPLYFTPQKTSTLKL